ncbi:MAG: hypothetical protein Q8928_14835 [Bacteroidota bacterium]|nr:hypothetical protein [Bacteroidota bacterium]
MTLSESALRMKLLIEKAIEEHVIGHDEYDQIIHIATQDGHIDNQERALLSQFQEMIDDRTIRIVPKK